MFPLDLEKTVDIKQKWILGNNKWHSDEPVSHHKYVFSCRHFKVAVIREISTALHSTPKNKTKHVLQTTLKLFLTRYRSPLCEMIPIL